MSKPKPTLIIKNGPGKKEDLTPDPVVFFQKVIKYLNLKFKQKHLPLGKTMTVEIETDTPKPQSAIPPNFSRKGVAQGLLWVLIMIAVGASGASVYFYSRYHQATQDPQEAVRTETDKLLSQVSRLILLPAGETPTIATISDPDKLKNQSFFSDARKGDKVLIYTNARKVFIYRPSIGKIISIAPLTVGGPSESGAPAPVPK